MERVSVIELKERIYCIHSNKLKASLHFRGKRKKKSSIKKTPFPWFLSLELLQSLVSAEEIFKHWKNWFLDYSKFSKLELKSKLIQEQNGQLC